MHLSRLHMDAGKGSVSTVTLAVIEALLANLPAASEATDHNIRITLIARIALCGVHGDLLEFDDDPWASFGGLAAGRLALLGGLVGWVC